MLKLYNLAKTVDWLTSTHTHTQRPNAVAQMSLKTISFALQKSSKNIQLTHTLSWRKKYRGKTLTTKQLQTQFPTLGQVTADLGEKV